MMANAVVKLAPSDFSFKQVQIGDLPLYNRRRRCEPREPSSG